MEVEYNLDYNIQDGRGLEYIKPRTVSKVLTHTNITQQHVQTIRRSLTAEELLNAIR